jgi:hypothetical protein
MGTWYRHSRRLPLASALRAFIAIGARGNTLAMEDRRNAARQDITVQQGKQTSQERGITWTPSAAFIHNAQYSHHTATYWIPTALKPRRRRNKLKFMGVFYQKMPTCTMVIANGKEGRERCSLSNDAVPSLTREENARRYLRRSKGSRQTRMLPGWISGWLMCFLVSCWSLSIIESTAQQCQ